MKKVLKGTIAALVLTLLIIAALALVTYFTDVDSKIISIILYVGTAVSVTAGALCAAKGCERGVLVHAMLVSLIYLAVLIAVSASLNRTLQFNMHFITMTAGILASGFLGAVLGNK